MADPCIGQTIEEHAVMKDDSLRVVLDLREEEHYNTDCDEWQFAAGSACAICTSSALQVMHRFHGVVQGYWSMDNTTALIGGPQLDGHDFALIASRWLVDYWAWHVAHLIQTPIFDLNAFKDRDSVDQLYGPTIKWSMTFSTTDNAHAEE